MVLVALVLLWVQVPALWTAASSRSASPAASAQQQTLKTKGWHPWAALTGEYTFFSLCGLSGVGGQAGIQHVVQQCLLEPQATCIVCLDPKRKGVQAAGCLQKEQLGSACSSFVLLSIHVCVGWFNKLQQARQGYHSDG
jgi:hypothetical protein